MLAIDVALDLVELLMRYGLLIECVDTDSEIPGSFWGESEAGLIDNTLLLRKDTPLHSALHEASHFICMTPARRTKLKTDAGGDELEECAVCYLQILLADTIASAGQTRMMRDMDAWGYSFRLGSAARWFGEDAEDARGWLLARQLIRPDNSLTYRLREDA